MSEGNAFEPCFECPAIAQAAQADYVNEFMRHLADPEIKLLTEKPHDWHNHGAKGKAAILAALTENVQLRADRDSWKKGCENWVIAHKATEKELLATARDLEVERQTLQKCCRDFEKFQQDSVEQATGLVQSYDAACLMVAISGAVNIVLGIAIFLRFFWG